MNKKIWSILGYVVVVAAVAVIIITKVIGTGEDTAYISISMEEVKAILESDQEKINSGTITEVDYIILDVRRIDEFSEGHIPGAINVANEDIIDTPPKELPNKNQRIYVYCRSGRRSKEAAEKLAAMGYTNIIEFGGIIDWTGEIQKP